MEDEAAAEVVVVAEMEADEGTETADEVDGEAPSSAPARKERGKYKKDRDAPRKGAFLTQDEAVQAAAAEGLELQRSDNSTSGFRGVLFRPNIKSKPYLVKHWVGSSYKLLGAFPTGEEAALTFARAKRDAANASASALAASSAFILGEDGQPIPSDSDPPAPKRARKLTRPLHSWSTEDDQRLLQLCQGFNEKRTTSLKTDWEPVAEKMGGFCSASAMKLRWRMLAGKKVGAANGAIGQRAAGIADGSILPSQLEGKRRSAEPDGHLAFKPPAEAGCVTIAALASVEPDDAVTVEATIVAHMVAPAAAAPAVSESLHEHHEHDHVDSVPALESAQYLDTVPEVVEEVPMQVPPAVEEDCGGEEGYDEVVEAAAVEAGEEAGEAVEAESVEVGMHEVGDPIDVCRAVPADATHSRHSFAMEVALAPAAGDGFRLGLAGASGEGVVGVEGMLLHHEGERGRLGAEEEEEDFMEQSMEQALREMAPLGDDAILS